MSLTSFSPEYAPKSVSTVNSVNVIFELLRHAGNNGGEDNSESAKINGNSRWPIFLSERGLGGAKKAFIPNGGTEQNQYLEALDQWNRVLYQETYPTADKTTRNKYEYDLVGNLVSFTSPKYLNTAIKTQYVELSNLV